MYPLRYYDYLVLVALLDESHIFRVCSENASIFDEVNTRFVRACHRYYDQLQRNCDDYYNVAPLKPKHRKPNPILYNPFCYMTFGRTDYAGLVLLDDFDPLLAITMDVRSPVESVSLGMCPRPDSLDLTAPEMEWIVSLDALLSKESQEATDAPAGSSHTTMVYHSFQTAAPLVAITSFKVNGPAILGAGIAFQQAIYRAMARQINITLRAMQESSANRSSAGFPLMTQEDIAAFRYCIIEPQGSDDVLLFMPCTNYSVAVAVICALRELTILDLCRVDTSLLHRIDCSSVGGSILGLCKLAGWFPDTEAMQRAWHPVAPEAGELDRRLVTALAGNHVFERTVTTLGASETAFLHPSDAARISGFMAPTLNIDISCGHLGQVEETLFRFVRDLASDLSGEELAVPLGLYTSSGHFAIGSHDSVFQPPFDTIASLGNERLANLPSAHKMYAMPTRTYLSAVRNLQQTWRNTGGPRTANADDQRRQPGVACVETGLLDLSTSLVIPFPRVQLPEYRVGMTGIDETVHAPLQLALRELRIRLCRDFDSGQPTTPSYANRDEAAALVFSMDLLESQLRKLGVPHPLRRTVVFLFHDFVAALGDASSFHLVADLYDIFVVLYSLLTKTLPSVQADLTDENSRRLFFTRYCIDDLSELARALQSAMAHRIASTRFHDDVRCADVVFRGGLTKLMSVVDVPLKCGLGIIRRIHRDAGLQEVGYGDVGGVAFLSARYRMVLRHIDFGLAVAASENVPRAVQVEMNVSQLFATSLFVDVLHEVAHAIQAAAVYAEGDPGEPSGFAVAGDAQAWCDHAFDQSRREELFVHFLLLSLVFQGDWKLFVRFNLMHVSMHSAVREASLDGVCDVFLEVALQLFAVADSAVVCNRLASDDVFGWPVVHPYAWNHRAFQVKADEAERLFQEFLSEYGRYFFYWRAIAADVDFRAKATDAFRAFWSGVYPTVVGEEYRRALATFRSATGGRPGKRTLMMLNAICRKCFDLGEVDIRGAALRESGEYPDELLVVVAVLYYHLSVDYQAVPIDTSIHLSREFAGADFSAIPEFPAGSRPGIYHVDPMSATLRCSDPDERRKRCLRDVSMIKVFWDVSTILRARRIEEIVTRMQGK
jgi:hypothetical protein